MTRTTSKAVLTGIGTLLGVAVYLHIQPAAAVGPSSLVLTQTQVQSSSPDPSTARPERALLNQYCVTCHNQRAKVAGLMLDTLDLEHAGERAEIWEKVVQKLRAGAMPPAGSRRPEKTAYDALTSWLETELDQAAAARPRPGRPVVQRLNRFEYTNAIRELLALEIDGPALLPTDESGYGFDNIADVLSISPGLLERYMIAAWKISRLAIGDSTLGPTVETYKVSRLRQQDERMSEYLPFGSVGGTAIRHYFPLDGEYALKVDLSRHFGSHVISGLEHREQLDVRLDGARIKEFTVGGECVGSKEPRCITPPGQAQASEYEATADDPLQVRFPVKAGRRLVGVSFVKKRAATAVEGAGPERPPSNSEGRFGVSEALPTMGVAAVTIEGPFNVQGPPTTPSRRRIFVCQPTGVADEESCATKILGTLARRAYRRTITSEDLQPLLGLYQIGRRHGSFETGIQFALEGLLVSPDFLLRPEREPANAVLGTLYRISDSELASRLSFFLWSSIPDDQLLALAAQGKLSDPAILEQQVRRMLADSRATAMVNNFASQWLYLRDLRLASPDTNLFPDFDDSLREAFQRESELFIESQLRDDRPLTDLLSANYTFVNERLARFYGIPNIYGTHFRRVTVNDPNRIGLLGHGSLLTVTSYSTRTSPVLRGKFVLDNFLGAPPAAPPPDVPDLKEKGEGGESATVRARMEAHRKNPVCASCHARMDPIGFALEKFNAIGRWRTTEFDLPIDSTGVLPDGTKLDGPAALRQALLARRNEFAAKVTERLLTYALGRGVEYYDRPAIRKILRSAAPGDYRWSAVVLGVVNSLPFQMRIASGQEPVVAVNGADNGSQIPVLR
jgi:mono/diheme cytochrome c family protein